jgi:hypothetical protein
MVQRKKAGRAKPVRNENSRRWRERVDSASSVGWTLRRIKSGSAERWPRRAARAKRSVVVASSSTSANAVD